MKTIKPENEAKLLGPITYAIEPYSGSIIRHPGNVGFRLDRAATKPSRSRYAPHVGKKQQAKLGLRLTR